MTTTLRKKQVMYLIKDELNRKTRKEFVALKPKVYNYIMDDGQIDKRAEVKKKCVIKQMFKFRRLQKLPGE